MKKYRAVIINPWYTPYRIPVLREIALRSEFDVSVVFCSDIEPGREWSVPRSLPFNTVYLNPITIFSYSNRKVFGQEVYFRYPKELVTTLISIKPDVIVELEFRLDSIVAFLYSLISKCGYVTWSDMTRIHDLRMGRIRMLIRRLLLARSKALIASCTDTKSHFHQYFSYPNEKIFISMLGSHVDEVIASAGIAPRSGRDVRDSDAVRFVYIGSLIPLKGVELLISAFARLRNRHRNVQLTIVGDGPELFPMQKMVQLSGCGNCVIFKGHLPFDRIAKEMILHDVFVFPTKLDVYGLVVAEAIACGLPVICSCFAGAANDLIKENGIIVDPYDTNAFLNAMERVLSADMRRKMTEACKNVVPILNLNIAADSFCDALREGIK